MKKLSIIFCTLLASWLLLFDQQIILQTSSASIDDYTLTSEQMAVVKNRNVISSENIANTDDDHMSNSVIGHEYSDDLEDMEDIYESESSSDDIIELNVGGQKMVTYRSTLTAVPNSSLALLFTKDLKDKTKLKRKHKKIKFFDYNPIQFAYLLDQLRSMKRMPKISAYELNIIAPPADVRFNFSTMLFELGLTPDRFLSPLVGVHLNLSTDSLIGWKECFRGAYNISFDDQILTNTCKGNRLLVACRSTTDEKTLVVAGVGKREDLLHPCSSNTYCAAEMKNSIGFYYAKNQAWGFEGRPKDFIANYHGKGRGRFPGIPRGSFALNPCDSSDQNSEYRLCWSLAANIGRGGGDRCGSSTNLHNTDGWERLIYQVD
ncbi:unnamed protein product [Adineta steineri]|uniref:Potassium channel tetramerisation-type BTB domain-containing protein n=1 Tax=Adineta steineri TaxID=433720 RepID=A0A815V2T3_9BILA|nr:unnamed protein product [Adineta steineri]